MVRVIYILSRIVKLCIKLNDMKTNMNSTDKAIRLLIAIGIITLYYTNVVSGTLGIVLMAVAGIFILTSFVSFCPIYAIFGLSSKKKQNAH